MTGLIIAGAVLLFLVALLVPRVRFDITAGEAVRITLRFWHVFCFRLYPKKRKKIRINQYTVKKIHKREKKLQKLREKAKRKEQRKKGEKPEEKQPLSEQLRLIIDLLNIVLPKLARALRIDLSYIVIHVASPDAARTAILYGVICQSVNQLLELLRQVTNVRTDKNTVLDVQADFLSEHMTVDVKLSLSLSPIRVIGMGITTLFRLLKLKLTRQNKA